MDKNNECIYKIDYDGFGDRIYYTGCDEGVVFIEGDLEENQYKYCPFCGKKIKLLKE